MTAIKHGVAHTLGVVGAGLTAGHRVRLVGLANQGEAVEVVPPEILLRDTGIGDETLIVKAITFSFDGAESPMAQNHAL